MNKSENNTKKVYQFPGFRFRKVELLMFYNFHPVVKLPMFLCLMFNVISISFAQNKIRSFEDVLKATYHYTVPLVNSFQVAEMGKKYDLIILDVREKREFEVSHLQNARYVGFKDFKIEKLSNVSKDRQIIVYCSVGQRSEMIGEILLKAGYENIYNLYGGIFAWIYHEYPVYDMKNNRTFKVHTYSDEWGVWLKKGEKVYE